MSYNNELYIFSEVPGYDASKGERIIMAFQKLRAKIEHLEQVRISEKNATLQKEQPNNDSDLTVADVQSEILQTQIRYLKKFMKEFANDKQSILDVKSNAIKEFQEPKSLISNNSELKTMPVDKDSYNYNKFTQTENNVADSISEVKSLQKQGNYSNVVTSAENVHRQNISTDLDGRVSHKKTKLNNQSHYHLKLNDVPFILGASSSASHSVVANVQNIIAMMKSHNRALCAPKRESHRGKASSTQLTETGANDMIRPLTEDLSYLTQRLEKLEELMDNNLHPSLLEKSKSEMKLRGDSSCKTKVKNQSEGNSCDFEKYNLNVKDKKQSIKKVSKAFQKPSDLSVRMQSNSNPQLARCKMLRSLKDLKTHLSAEDISWE